MLVLGTARASFTCRAAATVGVGIRQRPVRTGLGDVSIARRGGWDSYGALGVEIVQFTDRAQVAGQLVDADHYLGTREQFAALIGRPLHRKERPEMDQLPPTTMPADPDSDPRGWSQRNYDVGFDVAGGWEGGGQVVSAHNPTRGYGAPDGAVGVTLNYAAPGGAYVTEGRSG